MEDCGGVKEMEECWNCKNKKKKQRLLGECKRSVGGGGQVEGGRSNWCHIIPRKSPKTMSPF